MVILFQVRATGPRVLATAALAAFATLSGPALRPAAAQAQAASPTPKVDGPLAFSYGAPFFRLYSQNIGDSESRVLVGGPSADPAYSADGLQLAFIRPVAGGLSQVFVTDADGVRPPRQVTHDPQGAFDPAWSPTGDALAFTSVRDGNQEIYTINLDGSAERRLTTEPGEDREPDWAPTGDLIAFESDRAGSPDIWAMAPDGSNPYPLTSGPGRDANADWSPDGQAVAYASGTAIAVVDRRGVSSRQLTAGTSTDAFPVWAPDGRQIAFTSDRGPTGDRSTWVMPASGDPSGTQARQVLSGAIDADWGPLPSPPPTPVQLASSEAAAVPVAQPGRVTVEPPGADVPVPLVAGARIDLGSTVDATAGSVALAVKATTAKPAGATVAQGRVTVTSAGTLASVLVLGLRDRRRSVCPTPRAKPRASAARQADFPWRLTLRSHGRVRVVNRDAHFSSKGTTWRVIAGCRGTTVIVTHGVVAALDLQTGRTVNVHAGHRHFIRRTAP